MRISCGLSGKTNIHRCLEKNVWRRLETHEEPKNAYYRLFEKEEIVDKILKEFGLPVQGAHIINGHIPVIVKKGESPVKCGGKLLVIDGGFSKAYQPKTGIAGYTLIYWQHMSHLLLWKIRC